MMDAQEREVIDLVANALQSVVLLATQLRLSLGELNSRTASELEAAAGRAVGALKRLQPSEEK